VTHDDVTAQGTATGLTAAWVWQYFADVDTLDPARVARHYPADGRFRFGNAPPAVGPDAVRAALADFYTHVRGMAHRNTGLWLGDDSAVFEAEVTFTRPDGSAVTVPAVSILRGRDGRVADFRMVMDAAPLAAGTAGHGAADATAGTAPDAGLTGGRTGGR
jgi:ketosteroid isomerase-like protein